jgi:hypothetical protein
MLGLRIWILFRLDQLIQEHTVFRNIGFLGLSLDLGQLVFLGFLFWFFFGLLDQVFVWILVFL